MLRTLNSSVTPKTTFLLNALAASMLLAQHGQAVASAPTAGVNIDNTASATFDQQTGTGVVIPKTALSNTVQVKVASLYAINLTPAPQQQIEAGDAVTWLNVLTNQSNTSANVDVLAAVPAGLSNVKIYEDRDHNGIVSLGDVEITGPISLTRGQSVDLLVTGVSATTLTQNQVVDTPLTATLVEDNTVSASVVDSLIAIIPELQTIKTVTESEIDPSTLNGATALLNYKLSVENKSKNPVKPVDITVDGQTIAAVVVSDALPPNTTYVSATPADTDALVLFRTGLNSYTSIAPAAADVNEVIVAYKNGLNPKELESIALVLSLNSGVANTQLVNRFNIEYKNIEGNNQVKTSNPAPTNILGEQEIQAKDPDFKNIVATGSAGKPLYIEVDSAACNISRSLANKVWIEVTSPSTGDKVRVLATEVSPNSGKYRVELPTERSPANVAKLQDQILQTLRGDQVDIKLTDCVAPDGTTAIPTTNINTTVFIDPFGVVFNTATNQPVAGAKVILLHSDGTPVTDARDVNNQLIVDGKITTNSNGEFAYPLVTPGDYKFTILPSSLADLSFPSSKTPDQLDPIKWTINGTGSYGQTFSVVGTKPQPIAFDLPVDPIALNPALSVQKVASTKAAEIGDFVDYTVTVTNTGRADATDLAMLDTLPRGFVYVKNTMRVDGVKVADPQGKQGPYLTLGLNSLAPTRVVKVQYRVYIGPNALNGNGINRVRATATGVQSLEASAKVQVSAGVLMSDAFIIGKVYTDCNRSGVQDAGEQGVPGVRLYLEDGSFVVTDSEGKYDFYGISAKTHVLKLDRTTLPANVELVEQSNRNSGDPGSRFVDLKHGELHRADFAMTDGNDDCSTALQKQVVERKKLIADQNTDIERVLRSDLSLEPASYALGDVRGLAASGCISANGASADCNANLPNSEQQIVLPRIVKLDKVVAPVTVDLEDALKNAKDSKLEVLNLKDGQVLPYPQANIQVKGMLGTTIDVLVNGESVADSRIGKRAVLQDSHVMGFDYIGVDLKTGKNSIEIRQLDSMGNVRETRTLTVLAPGQMNRVNLKMVDSAAVEANGRNVMNVVVSLVDENGVQVASRTPVTIDSSVGKIQLQDLDPDKAGVQQFVEGGQLLVPLLSPAQSGEGTLSVESGIFKGSQQIRFTPELRPMIAAGILEGAISFNKFDPKNLSKVSRDDGFEQELNSLSSHDDGKLGMSGRSAFFLKGKVKGEYLLTMAYDSDKDKNQRLFRDIRPDEYYPVYGDSAAKGFDAQSTSKLYVRLDKGRSYAMYGDLTTRVDGDEGLSLGQYSRSLTGARVHHEDERSSVTGFVARTTSRQVVNEQRGLGISGPYSLGNVPFDSVLENSEKVEVLVRDRDNPGLVISRRTLSRFVDYEVDTLSNSLYLKNPISSQDEKANPTFLRITVESDQGGESYTVGGVAGKVQVNKNVSVGGSYVRSDDPMTKDDLASVNAVAKLSDRVKVVAEVARSSNTIDTLSTLNNPNVSATPTGEQSGNAGRIEINYADSKIEARVYHNQADSGFYNTSSPISAGRKETGARVQGRVPQVGLAKLEAIRTEDTANNGVRDGLTASIERAINQYLALEVGARFYQESRQAASATSVAANTPYSGTTLRAKLNAQLPWVAGSAAFVEYEQDVSDATRKVLAVGGSYQIGAKGRVYARHEVISSISGLYGLNDNTQRNSTVVGIDGNYMKDGTVFSEYRMRDGISAREAEAALGLRNQWHLAEGVRMNTSFEKIKSLKGASTSADATAVSLGVEYLADPRWKGVAKIEKRWAETSDSLLNTLGAAYKATDDVTLLAKNVYNKTDNKTTGDRTLDRFQVGAAYRDFDNTKFDALTKFEYRLDDNQSLPDPIKREVYIASAHANYHPVRRLTLASQYAVKHVRQSENQLSSKGVTQLLSGRAIYDINERWDTSLNAGLMWSDVSSGMRYLLGAEVGYLVAANLWVSGGYNFVAYQDDDLVDSDTSSKGAYLRVRFKFDEDMFSVNKPAVNKALEP